VSKLSRPKMTAPPETTAIPAELEDERQRWNRVREAQRAGATSTQATPAPGDAPTVVTTRSTNATRPPATIRENLARRLRRTSLPLRAGLHLRSLFTTANDNHEART
jgi:hypothetical protein